jgi:ribosomal RNA methyltransferase Nop2
VCILFQNSRCVLCATLLPSGTVFANEINKDRIKSIVGNVHRLGVTNTVVCNYDGRDLVKVSQGRAATCGVYREWVGACVTAC